MSVIQPAVWEITFDWQSRGLDLPDHPIIQIETRRTDFDTLDIDMDNIVRADIWQNTMDNL